MLKNVLSSLESHLNIVRRTVEKREALMNATPSIWPIHGWLSAGFGMRAGSLHRRARFSSRPRYLRR